VLAAGCACATYAQAPVSDQFNESTLNTSLWFVRTPAGGAAVVSGGELVLTVPGGSNHQAFTPLDSVRVVQPVGNSNFDVAIKIDSQLQASASQTSQGLLVGGDGSDYIFYEVYSDGTDIDLLAVSVDSGVQNIQLNTIPFTGYAVPTYLRLQRVGTTYNAFWSLDGASWDMAGSFNDGLHVTTLGPISGNNNSNPADAPAITASFDWFQNISAAATPVFTPAGGASFSSTQSVTIADATPGATIYYTTDGSTPTTASPVYSGAIVLSATTTVNAIATASGFSQSAVGSATYTYEPTGMTAAPGFTPPDGTSFSSPLSVNIGDSTSGSTIYYTTDGSTPTTSSPAYSATITLNTSTTIKAIAAASGYTPSAISSASYTYAPVAGAPVADEFNESTLNTNVWTVRVPAGGAAALSNGELVLTVPGGSNHQAYSPLDAVRAVQPVSNANFDVAVKIDSQLVASANQGFQGLLVGGDGSDYIYYYAYTDGANIDLLCASIDSGVQNIRFDIVPFAGYGVPTYLRMQHLGTTYTAYWSVDDVNWVMAGSFSDSLHVTTLGPMAGNDNSNSANAPPTSASFDWFRNVAAGSQSQAATPVYTPVSGTTFSSTLSVTISANTPSSTIYYTTDGSTPTTTSPLYSGAITLSASATIHAIAVANGYTQSAIGAASYTLLSAESPAATPAFTPASGTSFSSTLSVTIADSTPSATIYYTTDGSAPTTSSPVYSGAITLSASATVRAFATASGYTQSAVGSASYTYAPAAGAPVSDEFDQSSLNNRVWMVVTPAGGTAAVSSGELVLTVPAASNHDGFVPALDAVQVVQPISNQNFDVAVKIDSTLLASALYSGQGLMVEGDAHNYIRFEVAATGAITLTAATIESGTQSTVLQTSPFSGYSVPTYLRLQRSGTTYTAYWSADGVNWNNEGSFSDSLAVTGLAPYAWNYNATPSNAPAITAKFDWFHNLSTTAAVPTFSPASGASFSSPLSVTISDATPAAAIYYTTDGSTPTTSSQVYSGSITLDSTTVINAIALGNGFTQSELGSATYTYKPVNNGSSFSLSVEPASLALSPGLSQTISISAQSINGFSGTVDISFVNLPPGISVAPATLSLTPGSAQHFVVSASSSFSSSGTATLNATSGSLLQSQLVSFSALPAAPSSVVSSGLMAYFPMGDGSGSTIHDASSNAYVGSFGGSGNGWQAGGVSLNGQGWIDLPAALNSAQTIQMWVNLPATNPAAGQVLVGGSGSCCSGNTDFQIQPLQAGNSMQQLAAFSYGAIGALSSEPFLGSATLAFAMGNSSNSTSDQFWINGAQVPYQQGPASGIGFATGASAGSQSSGHYQIGAANNGSQLTGVVGPVAFYNRQLSPSEIAANAAYFNQLQQSRAVQTQLGNTVPANQFVGMGDSITYGYPKPDGPYCQYLAFNTAYKTQCLGVIGQTSSYGLSEAAQFAQYYAEAAPKNVMLVWFGTNDVTNGTPVSQIFANLLSICQTIKQVYPGWRVLLATMLSRYYNGLDYDPYKNSLNTLIRGNAMQQCDGFIDVAADPNLGADGAYGDSYFYDEIHPTTAGYEQVAAMTTSYINSLDGYTNANPNSQSSSSYKMTSADNYITANVNGTGAWTLPECQGLTGKSYEITNHGSGTITLSGTNSESMSGSDEVESGATAVFQIDLISPSAAGCDWSRTQ